MIELIVTVTAIKMIEKIFSPFPEIIGIGSMIIIPPKWADVSESHLHNITRMIPMKIKSWPKRKGLSANGYGVCSALFVVFFPSFIV
jgi:hypothetical protein